ncbi:MAG: PD-(D/E)XK nuclease family protein [Clostridiales bacterium]|nr:PD-(D/E)XK nuclease family protein [Clostridiales bacterium]
MKITNKLGLPQAFVNMAESDYQYKDKQYSVTSLLKGVRETILERRHHNEIEQDVSDMIWLLFGTAVHNILDHQDEGEHEFKEEYLKVKIGEYTLSGRFDLYNAKTKTVTDYKTCSVWKIIFGDYEDWKQQLLLYAYMLKSIGFPVERGEVIAIVKDHSKSQSKRKADYPELPVKKVTFEYTEKDFIDIEKWLEEKFDEIAKAEKLPDDKLPLCSLEERFNDGDKYAVMKKNRKRAMRVLDSKEDAEKWKEQNGGDFIEVRKGEDKKCPDYCRANRFCNYYQQQIKEEKTA